MSENYEVTGAPTTGHVWDDDLADLTNQPPKWWMVGLFSSVLFCVVYFLYYPSIPVVGAGILTKGIGGWTAMKELEASKSEVDAVRGKYEARLKDMTPAAILADSDLTNYVTRSGKVLFGDNCAACHGQNGVGTHDKEGLFAPVLNDDDWLFGGKIDNIYESISAGRQGMMTAHKDTLSSQQIDDVAKYVKALSEGRGDSEAAGKKVFMEGDCVACHGADGKGIQAMGSANLTDKIWRFDSSLEGIKRTIKYGVNSGDPQARVAVMPSFKGAGKLSDTDMKKLAVYVYKFGGGQADAPAAMAPAPAAAAQATK